MRSNIRSKKKYLPTEDTRISEAYNILKTTVANKINKDNSDIFGDYVANKHRKYDETTQNIVEHYINNILFEADIGKFKQTIQLSLRSANGSSDNNLTHSSLSPSCTSETTLPFEIDSQTYILTNDTSIQDTL